MGGVGTPGLNSPLLLMMFCIMTISLCFGSSGCADSRSRVVNESGGLPILVRSKYDSISQTWSSPQSSSLFAPLVVVVVSACQPKSLIDNYQRFRYFFAFATISFVVCYWLNHYVASFC